MADTKISGLSAASAATGAELVELVQGGTNKKATLSALLLYLAAPIVPADQTTDYTLVLTDAFNSIGVNSASAHTVTIPTNATVAFPIGTVLHVRQVGAGQVTIAPAATVTLRSPDALTKTRVQYSTVSLLKVATNVWSLKGDLA